MTPGISPPTDSLYKFISLFGLTILLFTLYNLGQVYDAASVNKMGIEDIKVKFQQELVSSQSTIEFETRTDNVRLRPKFIREIQEDLFKLSSLIEESPLPIEKKIEMEGEVKKLEINLSMLSVKRRTCYLLGLSGIILMIFGFFRWWKREQALRDKLLTFEYSDRARKIEIKRDSTTVK